MTARKVAHRPCREVLDRGDGYTKECTLDAAHVEWADDPGHRWGPLIIPEALRSPEASEAAIIEILGRSE